MNDAAKIKILEMEVKRLEESAKFWHDEYEILVDMLKQAPKMPTHLQLCRFPHSASQPDDWDKGKEMQRKYGLGVVPPVCEAEVAAGAWFRIAGGNPVIDSGQAEMTVDQVMNRHKVQDKP